MQSQCELWQMGYMSYQTAWDLQNELVHARIQAGVPDRLLLLEHPHIYTLGSSGHRENLLIPEAERQHLGIEVLHVDRGGDVTYHGPGQLIGYPIMQLPRAELRGNVTAYVRNLEKVIIDTLDDYGISGRPIAGLTGVWVDTPTGEAKICAIGVRINVKAVTKHGFALNINTDLTYFEGIIPCGIRDKGVTSMAEILGTQVDETEVANRLIQHFSTVFDCEMITVPLKSVPDL